MTRKDYNFYIQGPDDNFPERVGAGNEIEYLDMLERQSSDNLCSMRHPLNLAIVRQDFGWCET